ncbi:hypothetical protein MXE38_08820 [Anaerobiospirillum sp. NML120448]|uniref:LpxL/LpxP family acyltransferase n=1 Tax=Anaerobiospirillum sp. NML120448 TaxID=2932816 RepID=UPI001FF134FE|nr:hypothetical protein [Anaerobiospirillum sp. NML120448]MCK0514939.1 hypothetical protein [Anaerobiospirillum sp. NML120448]
MNTSKEPVKNSKAKADVVENAGYDPQAWRKLLGPKHWLSWLSLGLLAILSYIPNRIRDALAYLLSFPLTLINNRFKKVTLASLNTAFYGHDERFIKAMYRKMLMHAIITAFSYGEGTFLPTFMLKRRWVVKNKEVLDEALTRNQPIIFCVPHSFALDRCGLYLSCHGLPMFAVVNEQKNPVYDWFLNKQRIIFGGTIHTRAAGFRSIIKALKQGRYCYFLCDEDLGEEFTTNFVNFFGTPKAMVGSLPKLAKLTKAQVLVLNTAYNLKTANYELEFTYIEDQKDESDDSYLARVCTAFENGINKHPEQYMWFLRIFKTAPDDRYFTNVYINCNKTSSEVDVDYYHRRVPYDHKIKDRGPDYKPIIDYEELLKAKQSEQSKS